MKKYINPLSPDIFNLASNLIGIEQPAETKLKQNVAIASTVINLQVAKELDKRTFAVYPAIIEEAFSGTMNNYRKFVALKNFMFCEENDRINQYNRNVVKFLKENKFKLTEVQLQFSQIFIKSKKSLRPVQYNEKVDEFNNQYGLLVRKKKIQTIKPGAELIFQHLLYLYNQQLMKKNTRYMGCNITEATPLEPFKVNAWRVTQLKRDGVLAMPVCKKTILNHRKRFEEFGVLVDYHFINSTHAVEVHINPEILVLKDLQTSKLVLTENQQVTAVSGKIVPNDNVSFTRTFINEVKNEKKVKNFLIDKEFPSVTPFIFSFTRTPEPQQDVNLRVGGDAPVQVNTATQPAKQRKYGLDWVFDTIIPDSQLAKQLENCEFNNYIPIDQRVLQKVAYSSTTTRNEFFDIVLIDFFKSLQKNIYKKGNVFFGSWYNAIKLFRQQRFKDFNGNNLQAHSLVEHIAELRWRIQWARNWYRKNPNVTPLFPNQYLDVTRKTSKEVGFEYTKCKWNDQIKEIEKYDALAKKQENEAKKRGIAINYNKKLQLYLNRFTKDKITLNQLYDSVENNLPAQMLHKLPKLIEQKQLEINQKTIFVQYSEQIEFSALEF